MINWMETLRIILYIIIQLTWGILQSMLGCGLLLLNIRRRHYWYHGALVTEWGRPGGISLGMFVFTAGTDKHLLVHEYGHTLQSLLLGPLYLPVIGMPSLVWASLPQLRRWRAKNSVPYARLYAESWANKWGEKATGEASIGG